MTISEPSTLVTDYILGCVCLVLSALLFRHSNDADRARFYWAAAFGAMAVAAFVGGTYHGTLWLLKPSDGTVLWKITMFASGLASFFMVLGAAAASVQGTLRAVFSAIAAFKFFAFLTLMAKRDDFSLVIFDFVPALIVVAALGWRNRWTIAGAVLSVLGAVAHLSGLGLGDAFNHNDIFHLLQTLAVVALYRGVAGRNTQCP